MDTRTLPPSRSLSPLPLKTLPVPVRYFIFLFICVLFATDDMRVYSPERRRRVANCWLNTPPTPSSPLLVCCLMNFYECSRQKLSVTTTTVTTANINNNKHCKSEIYMIAAQRWNIQGNNNNKNNTSNHKKNKWAAPKIKHTFRAVEERDRESEREGGLCKQLDELPEKYWQMCVCKILRKIFYFPYYFNGVSEAGFTRWILMSFRNFH